MKANNTSIETALQLAFSTEYVNAFSLVSLAETWEADSDAKGLALNISYFAEQCTYKMEQDGVTLESDAWDTLTAEIERYANIWVSLYLNASSWSNRPEWLANSVRAALDNTTKPEPTNPDNTPTTMNANEINAPEFSELSHAAQCLDIYLHNTREIYGRYTVPAIRKIAAMMRSNATHPQQFDVSPAGVSGLWEVIRAISAAAGLVRKYDKLAPTQDDKKQVTRNYAAYIVDCAEYEIENA